MKEFFGALGLIFILLAQVLLGLLATYFFAVFAILVGGAIRDLLSHKKHDSDC